MLGSAGIGAMSPACCFAALCYARVSRGLVGAAPALLTLLISLFVPESERWKESVAKEKSKPLQEIFSGGLIKSTLLGIAFASVALIVTWGIVQWLPLWADQMTGGKQPKVKAYVQLAASVGANIGTICPPLCRARFGRLFSISETEQFINIE